MELHHEIPPSETNSTPPTQRPGAATIQWKHEGRPSIITTEACVPITIPYRPQHKLIFDGMLLDKPICKVKYKARAAATATNHQPLARDPKHRRIGGVSFYCWVLCCFVSKSAVHHGPVCVLFIRRPQWFNLSQWWHVKLEDYHALQMESCRRPINLSYRSR